MSNVSARYFFIYGVVLSQVRVNDVEEAEVVQRIRLPVAGIVVVARVREAGVVVAVSTVEATTLVRDDVAVERLVETPSPKVTVSPSVLFTA